MFNSIRPISFRNLSDAEIDTSASEVCLVGKNGQGKSNFLEAIYFLAFGSSFRTHRDSDLITLNNSSCSVIGNIQTPFKGSMRVSIEAGKKSIFIDNKKIEDRKQLIDIKPVIIFSHEDLQIIVGEPEKRRWFFDQCASMGNLAYIDYLRTYKKIVKTRNSIIKTGNIDLLDVVDYQLAEAGLLLLKEREQLQIEIAPFFSQLFCTISTIENVHLKYLPSWKEKNIESIIKTLKHKRSADLALLTTTSGPHRDRWMFTWEGKDFIPRASTGQRRLLALLLRILQSHLFLKKTGKKPIYLLDDVLLELDYEKKLGFFDLLPEYEQAFFTFLPNEFLLSQQTASALIYKVQDGKISV